MLKSSVIAITFTLTGHAFAASPCVNLLDDVIHETKEAAKASPVVENIKNFSLSNVYPEFEGTRDGDQRYCYGRITYTVNDDGEAGFVIRAGVRINRNQVARIRAAMKGTDASTESF